MLSETGRNAIVRMDAGFLFQSGKKMSSRFGRLSRSGSLKGYFMGSEYKRLNAVYLLFGIVFMSSVSALQGALLSAVISAYRLESSAQGLSSSAAFAGGTAALAATLFLRELLPKRTLLNIAIALSAASLAALRFASGYTLFIGIWLIAGFGMGMMDTLLSACMADLYQGKTGERMMCLLHVFYGLASMLSPLLYERMMEHGIAWNSVYLYAAAYGGLLLAAFVLARLLLRGRGQTVPAETHIALKQMLPVIRDNHLLRPISAMFFHGLFLAGLNTWINRYGQTLKGNGILPAMSFMFLGLMLSRLLIPYLPLKTENYIRVSGIAAGAVLAAGLFFDSRLFLNGALLVSGLFFGAMIPCILNLACSRMQGGTLLATTALMLALYLGESLSSPIIGALEAAFSLRVGIAFCAVCMVLSSMSLSRRTAQDSGSTAL